MNCIELENITLAYRDKVVLSNLGLTVPTGKVCALIGPNGSGKTSLLRIMAGLIKPAAGKVSLLGKSVTQIQSDKAVSFIFEPSPLNNMLTAWQNLKLKCCILGVPYQNINFLLNKVGLERSNKLVKDFSYGMKKRLELAYALLGDPELLILDEPFNGLDIYGIDTLRSVIAEYKANGKSVFISEHNFHVIGNIADSFAILYDGKIINTVAASEIGVKYADLEIAYKENVAAYEKTIEI